MLLFQLSGYPDSEMAPKAKDSAWAHADVVDGVMYCKYCKKLIKGGGIYRLKQHLAAIKGHVKLHYMLLDKLELICKNILRSLKRVRLGKER